MINKLDFKLYLLSGLFLGMSCMNIFMNFFQKFYHNVEMSVQEKVNGIGRYAILFLFVDILIFITIIYLNKANIVKTDVIKS